MINVRKAYPVIPLRIRIRADEINLVVAGIPARGDRVPLPEEVVQAVRVGQSIVQEVPELLRGRGALCAPPEPAALCLVQGAEDDGHACGLQLLELDGDGVDVAHEEGVVCVGGVPQRGRDVEVGGVRVEAAVPGVFGRVVQADRRAPVPVESHDAALLREGEGLVDVGRRRAPRLARLDVVHKVDAQDGWRLAHVLRHPVQARLVVLARQHLLAVDAAEVLEQRLCVLVRFLVDGLGGYLVRSALGRRGDRDGVDEVPSPVVLDLDGVGARVEEHLACGDSGPVCRCRKGNLGAADAVEDHGRVLVAIRAAVDDAQVV